MNVQKIALSGPVDAVAAVPGSKSITNRALLIAALASGESILTGALDSEDTRVMCDALRTLGVGVVSDGEVGASPLRVVGCGGTFPVKEAELYVANSGTTARFLTAALAFSGGTYRVDGKERMRERPIGDLLDALRSLGAVIESERQNGCPPIRVRPSQKMGGEASVAGNISSQFLSALLMAAPVAAEEVRLNIAGELVSRPYVEMTLAVMKAFGAEVQTNEERTTFFLPPESRYQAERFTIEPDASAASYFFAIPAICGGRVAVRGLSKSSLQGDVGFVDCLAAMGCRAAYDADQITVSRPVNADGSLVPLVGVDVDMNNISDTAQTLAVVALFAESPTRIRNIAHVRGKETDRIRAMVTELRKLGARVDEFDDGLCVWPDISRLHAARIATYDAHRMAMSFALAGLKIPGVEIEHPECTVKTYPNFFADLAHAVREF